jgi:hypothetical protein
MHAVQVVAEVLQAEHGEVQAVAHAVLMRAYPVAHTVQTEAPVQVLQFVLQAVQEEADTKRNDVLHAVHTRAPVRVGTTEQVRQPVTPV